MGTPRLLSTRLLVNFIAQSVGFGISLLPTDCVILRELWQLDSIINVLPLAIARRPILHYVLSASVDDVVALSLILDGAEFAGWEGADFEGAVVLGEGLLGLGGAWLAVTVVLGRVLVVCGSGAALDLMARAVLLSHLGGWVGDGEPVGRPLNIILAIVGGVVIEIVTAIVSVRIAMGVFWTNFSSLSLLVVTCLFLVIFAVPTDTHDYHDGDEEWEDDD